MFIACLLPGLSLHSVSADSASAWCLSESHCVHTVSATHDSEWRGFWATLAVNPKRTGALLAPFRLQASSFKPNNSCWEAHLTPTGDAVPQWALAVEYLHIRSLEPALMLCKVISKLLHTNLG